jgi:hypothetical protein
MCDENPPFSKVYGAAFEVMKLCRCFEEEEYTGCMFLDCSKYAECIGAMDAVRDVDFVEIDRDRYIGECALIKKLYEYTYAKDLEVFISEVSRYSGGLLYLV